MISDGLGGAPSRNQDAVTAGVGETFTLVLNVPDAKVSHGVALPHIDGLTLNGTGTNPQPHVEAFNFFLTPSRKGDFTIPAFDLRADDGQIFHVNALKLHVGG